MKKRYKIIIGIIILLVAVRIYLPYGIIKFVNKTLADIPGYTGYITDVDLQLYKGSYSIDSLNILKQDSSVAVPFFSSDRIDLSVQWSALFDGSIVGEIELVNPDLNFVAAKDTTQEQFGEDVDWTKPVKELMPLQINKFTVTNGTINFKNFDTEPKIDIFINDFFLVATNLNNAESNELKLPSTLSATATSIGGGKLDVSGGLNLLKQVPDMDIDAKFEGVNLPALNDFLRAYAKLDAEGGTFDLYSEVVVNDGKLKGYVKPIITDLNLVKWSEDKDKPLQMIWETVASVVIELFENQKKDQFATKTPFSGDLNTPDVKIMPTIWNIFKNAFINAFNQSIDGTLDFGADNTEDGDKDKKKKKD
ncbi:MAG: DUF748 domain-containing protein [Cyclobacteriaceae bacterium]